MGEQPGDVLAVHLEFLEGVAVHRISMSEQPDLVGMRPGMPGVPLVRGRGAPARHSIRLRMSSAVRAPDASSPESMTLANRAAFLAFMAMTFSSMVSLATRR